ncbi:MAG: DNA-binding protein HU [Deltaproteobacteria bacterium CG07_land_8_20_14_0_80_38_7]|nr:MAG: DNA-binding protein HU [Deltaproteobacteria bacterium CG07_land_8_20_14_0_80_38_7]
MTKAELVNYISKDCNTSKALAETALNSTVHNIAKCLRRKDKITLTGFGTFYVTKRKARVGRNPQTGAEINIKARSVPRFKPGKQLKEWIK